MSKEPGNSKDSDENEDSGKKPRKNNRGYPNKVRKGKLKGGKGLPRHKQDKPGPQPKKRENIAKKIKEKAKKNGRKKANVLLPVLFVHPEKEAPPEEMTEAEISYKDMMLSVHAGVLARKGFNDKEIIEQLGVNAKTYYRWMNEKPFFAYRILMNRGILQARVEDRLIDNALGFAYQEQQMAGNGVVRTVTKYRLPDVKAQQYFLNNQSRKNDVELWQSKVEATHTVGAGMEQITFVLKKRE